MPRAARASPNASSQAADEWRSATATVTLSPGRTSPRRSSCGRPSRTTPYHSTRERSMQQFPDVETSTRPMRGTVPAGAVRTVTALPGVRPATTVTRAKPSLKNSSSTGAE